MSLPIPVSPALSTVLERGCFLFLLLMLYSFIGWCGEMIYCSAGQRRLCEKRGFLNGLICPIYGHGALLVLWALNGGCESPLLTFLLGALLTSAVEYVTSFVMEKLFHMRWWDYSRYRFQINGRVCLLNSALFGLACVALCHLVNPIVSRQLAAVFAHGIGVPLALFLFALYAADIVLSIRSAVQMGKRLEKLHAIHDELAAKLEQLRREEQAAMEARKARLELAVEATRQAAAERRDEAVRSLQERLDTLPSIRDTLDDARDALAQRLEQAREEAQKRLQALYDAQDVFERRLMRAYPALRSLHHGEALKKLREYREKRKH